MLKKKNCLRSLGSDVRPWGADKEHPVCAIVPPPSTVVIPAMVVVGCSVSSLLYIENPASDSLRLAFFVAGMRGVAAFVGFDKAWMLAKA